MADPYNNGPAPAISKTGATIVKDLVSTIEPAIEAVPPNGPYTNADTARFYQAADFTYFDEALRAAALNECGGTLTLQTRVNGTPANDEFVYENSETRDASNTPTGDPTRTVTTSSLYRTGTFDFEIAGALPYHVDVIPQSLQTLEGFNPVGGAGGSGWTCRAGSTDLTGSVTVQAIPASSFFKFTVDVAPEPGRVMHPESDSGMTSALQVIAGIETTAGRRSCWYSCSWSSSVSSPSR